MISSTSNGERTRRSARPHPACGRDDQEADDQRQCAEDFGRRAVGRVGLERPHDEIHPGRDQTGALQRNERGSRGPIPGASSGFLHVRHVTSA